MRGQAFVVFDDVNSAATALRAMRGFPLYEKPMRIQFAKTDSDVVAKRKGTYVPRPKVVNKAAAAAAAAEAAAAAAAYDAAGPQGGTSARAIRRRQQRAAAAAAAAAAEAASAGGAAIPPPESGLGDTHNQSAPPPPPPPINPATIPDQPPNKILFLTNLPEDANEAMISMLFNQFTGYREPMRVAYAKRDSTQIVRLKGVSAEANQRREEEREKRKRRKAAQRRAAAAAAAQTAPQAAAGGTGGDLINLLDQPNHILFVNNLPEETTDAMLTMLFSQFSGFKEARRAVGGVGFVEYETDSQAAAARSAYDGFKLTPTHAMEITFAKK
ncbi:U2 small nuclear ribonucleoprotein B [Fasciolopsis buskii]|uniref:U2 small nuclear ribonucleoprotein B n=1 Tax=Fasciolopsis buskii TaxID=27845 RepID=A0A8E0VEH0_9TREM|nr:U2 small nuclear ribonucleoprotein B [Fasciolopsis buski]